MIPGSRYHRHCFQIDLGNDIDALRSPEFLKTLDYAAPNSVVGLVVVDISDVKRIRAVREATTTAAPPSRASGSA